MTFHDLSASWWPTTSRNAGIDPNPSVTRRHFAQEVPALAILVVAREHDVSGLLERALGVDSLGGKVRS